MHQMSFGGRAPPGPAGGAYCALRPLAALKLLAPWALDPWRLRRLASRLRRSETAFRFFFFPFEHWFSAILANPPVLFFWHSGTLALSQGHRGSAHKISSSGSRDNAFGQRQAHRETG